MRVKIRFFAILRERAGTAAATREIQEGSTVRELWKTLQRDYPGLAPLETRLLYAVNQNYVSADYVLKAGDEVVFVPPVSGG